MAFELKENSGSLFKNDKRTTDNHPHAKGQAKIGGVLYWVSAWTKETNSGDKYQSLSFTPKDDQPARQPVKDAIASGPTIEELDDEIPF